MADKKITALTELTSTGKVSSTDLLHIIDYSASPVNKKITVSNLLKDANTQITSFGAFAHDLGPTNAISGLSVVVANTTPAAAAETEVIVNDDGNAFVDFRVESGLSISAIHVDASLDTGNGSCNTVTINGDSAKVDFRVNSDTSVAATPLLHCDAETHAIGIGKQSPDTAYLLDIAAESGKSIKTAGGIDVTGVSSITGATTITGAATITGSTSVGVAASGTLALASTESLTSNTGTANHGTIGVTTTLVTMTGTATGVLPNSTVVGQIKIMTCIAETGGSHTYTNTPATMNGFTSFQFDAPGDAVVLMWTAAGWAVIATGEGTTLTA
jgi:hypothetical protein